MIQRLWRGLMARRTAAFLRRQQISEWEEVWNDEAAVFYFFHKPSGGSSWEVSWCKDRVGATRQVGNRLSATANSSTRSPSSLTYHLNLFHSVGAGRTIPSYDT